MRPWLILLMLLAAFTFSGCLSDDGDGDGGDDPDGGDDGNGGGDGNSSMEPDPVTIEVALTGAYPVNIAFDPSAITVKAGQQVTIKFTNNDQNPIPGHDWVLEGFEDTASTDVADNGETVEVTFTAPSEPGDYAFYCSIGDHRDQGMEGTLTVE